MIPPSTHGSIKIKDEKLKIKDLKEWDFLVLFRR
jgi:hypothetical protein